MADELTDESNWILGWEEWIHEPRDCHGHPRSVKSRFQISRGPDLKWGNSGRFAKESHLLHLNHRAHLKGAETDVPQDDKVSRGTSVPIKTSLFPFTILTLTVK